MQFRRAVSSRWSRAAVVLTVLALLTYTTVRTSPITAGLAPGSSFSSKTLNSSVSLKQRQFSFDDFNWTALVLTQIAPVPQGGHDVVPAESEDFPRRQFQGRYFDLPPPSK